DTTPAQTPAKAQAPVQKQADKPAVAPQAQPTERKSYKVTTAGAGSYTVKSGDTLSAIAAAHGTTVDALYGKNVKTVGANPDVIFPGQVLSI
ncbi:transglycosylase, partial [Streptomyces tateyamensis]